MGIYDREYYRDETGGSGWFSGLAPATRWLILINIGVYLLQVFSRSSWLIETFSAQSDAIFEKFHVWQLVSYAFLHDTRSFLHIAINMLFLYFMGREVEPIYGTREFVWFYLAAAVVSGLVWSLIDYSGASATHGMLLGASGAVSAVLIVYVLYYPQREFLIWGVLPIRAWMFLAFYVVQQVFSAYSQFRFQGEMLQGTSIAYTAHLAGLAYGWAYKASGFRWSQLFHVSFFQNRPRLRIVPPPERRERGRPRSSPPASTLPDSPSPFSSSARPSTTGVVAEEQLDAQLDEILAKIAREGRASLSDDEHRILQEASRRARNKRSERLH